MSSREYDNNDFLRVEDNPISKVGVFPYWGSMIDPNGEFNLDHKKIYYVFRPDQSLNNARTIKSCKNIPIINEHEMLGRECTPAEKKGVDGTTGEQIYFDNNTKHLRANLNVFSENLKNLIKMGKVELSLGYRSNYVKKQGVWQGKHYDFIQVDIMGNHLALVHSGRSGSDVAVLDYNDIDDTIISNVITYDNLDIYKKSNLESLNMENDKNKNPDDNKSSNTPDDGNNPPADQSSATQDMEQTQLSPETISVLNNLAKVAPALIEMVNKKPDNAEPTPTQDGEHKTAPAPAPTMDVDDIVNKITNKFDERLDAKLNDFARNQNSIMQKAQQEKEQIDALYNQVSPQIGTFDHSDMNINELAKYSAEKLNIDTVTGQELGALQGYLQAQKANFKSSNINAGGNATTDSNDTNANAGSSNLDDILKGIGG